ncbi:MAG: hypothetical protein LBD90_08920 [Bifidobacteriaceae bacterium]|jgi:hypothetical protein|nr:hypothetical protein [Bifidobacteriaceae bacterium]
MTDSLGAILQPGLRHLAEEKERQRNHIHQLVVDAPPWDTVLDEGKITIRLPGAEAPRPSGASNQAAS